MKSFVNARKLGNPRSYKDLAKKKRASLVEAWKSSGDAVDRGEKSGRQGR